MQKHKQGSLSLFWLLSLFIFAMKKANFVIDGEHEKHDGNQENTEDS